LNEPPDQLLFLFKLAHGSCDVSGHRTVYGL